MDDELRCADCGAPAQAKGPRDDDGVPTRVVCSSLLCPTNLAGSPDTGRAAS